MEIIDINQLHKAFDDPNAFGQTTLMFDSVLRVMELNKMEGNIQCIIFGRNIKHCETLQYDFSNFIALYISKDLGLSIEETQSHFVNSRNHVWIKNYGTVFFKPLLEMDSFLMGRKNYYLFVDHYCYQ